MLTPPRDKKPHPFIRRTWPILAVLSGLLLIFFEYRDARGITADNAFWLFVGALIVILGVIDLLQKRPDKPD
jgi:hypothetical protein